MHLTHEFGPMCCYLIGHLNSGISLKKTNKQNNPHQTPKPTNPKTQTQHKKNPTKNNTKQTKKNPTQNKAPTKKPQTLITTKFWVQGYYKSVNWCSKSLLKKYWITLIFLVEWNCTHKLKKKIKNTKKPTPDTKKPYAHQPRKLQNTNWKTHKDREGIMFVSTAMFPVVQHNLLTVKKVSPNPQPASRAVLTIHKHFFISTMFNNHQFYANDAEKAPENENRITNMLFVRISAGERHPENDVL